MRVLIAGCGYVGQRLGAELLAAGHQVWGARRSSGASGELKALGIEPVLLDITESSGFQKLPGPFDWVINLVSSSRGGAEEYRRVYREGSLNLIDWMSRTPPTQFVYTGSTSVYGQTDGSWVDEDSPVLPASPTSRILVETENLLIEEGRKASVPTVILRLSGIYGPGRGHLFQQFLKNEALLTGAGDRILNMVHLGDVTGAILAALARGEPGEVYNVTDDEPVTERTFFTWLAAKLNRPLPRSAQPSDLPERKRGQTSKRVSNAKMRAKLAYQCRYPTFREGYAQEIRRLALAP